MKARTIRLLRRALVLTVAPMTLLGVPACSTGTPTVSTAPAAQLTSPQPATTQVDYRDIYRTLRLDGTVVPYPPVNVGAAADGVFIVAARIKTDRRVTAGQPLGYLSSCPVLATGSPPSAASPAPTASTRGSTTTTSTGGTKATTSTAGARASTSATGSEAAASTAPAAGPLPCARPNRSAVRAPVAGTVSPLADRVVTAHEVLGTVQPPGFHIRLPVTDPASMYTFTSPPRTARAQIVGGPSGFTVAFERTEYSADSGAVAVYVSLPTTVPVFAGLKAVVVFVTATKSHVPTLPRSAVQGTVDQGQVVTVDVAGHRKAATVRIGASDAEYVEVQGLAATQKVLLYPLESDFAD